MARRVKRYEHRDTELREAPCQLFPPWSQNVPLCHQTYVCPSYNNFKTWWRTDGNSGEVIWNLKVVFKIRFHKNSRTVPKHFDTIGFVFTSWVRPAALCLGLIQFSWLINVFKLWGQRSLWPHECSVAGNVFKTVSLLAKLSINTYM